MRAGYIAESFDKSDAYIVTNTGNKAVTDGFLAPNGQPVRRKKRASGSSSGNAKNHSEPEWLKDLSVEDQLENFPSYRIMKTRSDKVLWILQWAKSNNRDKITGNDVVSIADKLADSIPSKQIAAAFSPHLSKLNVSKNSEGYGILYKGTEYLKGMKE